MVKMNTFISMRMTTDNTNGSKPSITTLHRYSRILGRIGLLLLPSPVLVYMGILETSRKSRGSTDHLTGLRGIACLAVFSEHFLLRFHPNLLDEYGLHPQWYQLPGIRLLYSGSVMVTIFFIISGFSLSVGPLRAIYDRDWECLHHLIFSASLRRAPRLVLPPAMITFVVMIGTQFSLYQSRYPGPVDMDWTGPIRQPTFALQVLDWLEYVLGRLIYPAEWLHPLPTLSSSEYAVPLYTIPMELWSSFLLFTTIVALSKVRCAVRMTTLFFLVVLSAWCMRKEISCFLVGMFLAEIHIRRQSVLGQERPRRTPHLWKFLTVSLWSFVLLLGIWMSSIPHTRGAYGSSSIGYRTISQIIPWNSNVYTIGAGLVVLAIDRLTLLQALLSSAPVQYLGNIPFSLYMVHWPIFAAWGWNMVPFMCSITGDRTTVRYAAGLSLAVLSVIPIVFWVADLCWRFVDETSIHYAKRWEKLVSVE